ncbi:MAG TPA: aminotransferase class I/II-fold pyridoxal phosphate-dependent enzyme [Verrucomicrobia bacterium]|nr:aminotransferase class I/II-fold pyridoxal phosphate-dependent enzyme [Verrucomicrobiota bacterium]HOP96243.1 histidinol-phosphate transaminase [Verrucomicrobiota bacterium]HPU56177.1 histidinol-phosphate transaminase [Verrucomicrobiota bacterium]
MNASPLNGLIQPERVIVRLAETSERRHLYRLRHEVYACELGQHAPSPDGLLSDALDEFNEYIVAAVGDVILGFVSITPPGGGRFSIDKYIARGEFPMLFSDRLYEVRLLTVLNPYRGRELALLLMYAAFRWIRKRGGERVVAIGRREVLSLYLRVGLEKLGRSIQSGAVRYELLSARTDDLEHRLRRHTPILNRLERGVDWRLDCPFREPAACFHGGAFFDGIGVEFEKLERRHRIINADVLDAWFPPAPGVVDALRENLEWAVRTSPPTACEGLLRAIANARSVPVDALVPGAGSSALIFLAFPRWLTPDSRVLLLDPTYGEYAHMLEQVVRCRVDRVRLRRERHYDLDGERLRHLLKREYDLVVLVNPNSPTGRHVPANVLKSILSNAPGRTRFWIDETYVEYAGAVESLERFAAASRNVVVCKSMSKVYALSGLRVAYLCGPTPWMAELRSHTPPWAIGLPAQMAAVAALRDPGYYAARYRETHRLRERLRAALTRLGWYVVPGSANFLLCHLPESGPSAAALVDRCRAAGLYLRDAGGMGRNLGTHALRIAVKDSETNARMLGILASAWQTASGTALRETITETSSAAA